MAEEKLVVEEKLMEYVINNMNDGFNKIDKKLDNMRVENSEKNKDAAKNCSVKRTEIYDRIEGNRIDIEKLDKKIFQLFYVGTGIGFLLGVATTIVAKNLIGG